MFEASKKALKRASQWWADQRGGSATFIALAMIPLVGSMGVATDVARSMLVKNRLTESLDAASLAAGRQSNESQRAADADRYFWANYVDGYLGTAVDGPHLQNGPDDTVILTATAELPTTFSTFFGLQSISIDGRSVVQRNLRGMELVLVMDNTGSMRGSGKMAAMKDAAQTLVDTLYGDRETVTNFWVSLVPYAASVNIGPNRTSWLDASFNSTAYDLDPNGWKGCVEARQAGLDMTDDVPTIGPWRALLWNSDDPAEHNASDSYYNVWPQVKWENYHQNGGRGPNLGCPQPITSLQASKGTITSGISQMEPWHRGGTMSHMGLVWGWRVLSPEWRGLWGGDTPSSLPTDYDDQDIDKVVILLTDGVNEWYQDDFTAYRRLSEGLLGTTSKSQTTNILNTRMAQICADMKAEGVKIYTLTFRLSNNNTKQLFRDCASAPYSEHYFDSPSNDTLKENFELIAEKLSRLRISE
ncbi:MAG: pilus assembly protein TadG-related protein [Pseudomonadota bacterium]